MYDGERSGRVALHVRSWIPLERQTDYRGLTWLDTGADNLKGERLESARKARLAFLRDEGWLPDGLERPDAALRDRLRRMELRRIAAAITSASGRTLVQLEKGDGFQGKFERVLDLGQGRYSMIANAKEFALVPWRPEMERQRGRELVIRRTSRGVSWTIGIDRGINR